MNSINKHLPIFMLSLAWNDRFSYKTAINSITKIDENPQILRKQLDELIDFKRKGDTDVYEFLEIPRLSKRKSNGYRPALNLCCINNETKYLKLTEISKEILKIDKLDEQIKILFLIASAFYPHIRALLDVLILEKIYFKRSNSVPTKLEDYYTLPDKRNLREILLTKWNSNNFKFLKDFLTNPPVNGLIKNDFKDHEKVKIELNHGFTFSETDFQQNVFNQRTSKTCVNLLGLNDDTRSILYDYNQENDDLGSIKLNEDLIYLRFLDFSMRDFLSPNIIPSKMEAIDRCICENYSLDIYYTLQELLYDIEDLGFLETEILEWKLNIEKNQVSNNSFNSIILRIETKSGVMGALGLLNNPQHAKLKFLKKDI